MERVEVWVCEVCELRVEVHVGVHEVCEVCEGVGI